MKKTVHCIHYTHWDLIWYFTAQDATVQPCYDMKEMLEGPRNGRITDFFFNGQSALMDEYRKFHSENEAYARILVAEEGLAIGPFHLQLDCFICNNGSVINNLRFGMRSAENPRYTSRAAYLLDSFEHSWGLPKIFHQFEVKDFVITRGVGDDYKLGNEFYMKSNDNSELLACTMIAGYGYGYYAFRNGTLSDESALDYNKISVQSLIDRLLPYSTPDHEFVFSLDFNQNPAMLSVPKRIAEYNVQQTDVTSVLTTRWDFYSHVKEHDHNLKCHEHELFSTQCHRVHYSIFSAHADIEALRGAYERKVTYGPRPLMSMLDAQGIPYDHGLIDEIWNRLLRHQTHSSATLTDETNDCIQQGIQNAYNLITSQTVFLMKLFSLFMQRREDGYPLLVCNTLPYVRTQTLHTTVQAGKPDFRILLDGKELPHMRAETVKKNCGVLRKDVRDIGPEGYFYETEIILQIDHMKGLSYRTLYIQDIDQPSVSYELAQAPYIEDNRFRTHKDEEGVRIFDYRSHREHRSTIYLEEFGDERDSSDYPPLGYDWIPTDHLEHAEVSCIQNMTYDRMTLTGTMGIPRNLKNRKDRIRNSGIRYRIRFELTDRNDTRISGTIDNHATDHRIRLVFTGQAPHTYLLAGTQYSYTKRKSTPAALKTWKADGWFEEPSPAWPLLNYASAEDDEVMTVMTKNSKEYELIDEDNKDIVVVLFRSYSAMGYPDLYRRPGRSSGLDYTIFQTPGCQIPKENSFNLTLIWYENYDGSRICQDHIQYICPQLCFEEQYLGKPVHPISYSPTNSPEQKLPDSWSFLNMDEPQGCFGSLMREKNYWSLRLYNNGTEPVSCDIIHSDETFVYTLMALDHTIHKPPSSELELLRRSKLRMIQIERA